MKRKELLQNIAYLIRDGVIDGLESVDIAESIIELQEELDVVKEWEE